MKSLLNYLRPRRAIANRPAPSSSSSTIGGDDTLGSGMDLALTVALFVVIGLLLDRWLGLFPILTVSLIVFASVGSFIRMKYAYDARMEQLEADRRAGRVGTAARDLT